MIDRNHRLSVTRQARMLGISRASVYYIPRPVSEADLKLMRAMDELHLEYPFAGSRMLRDLLRQDGFEVGRKQVTTLMKRMGIEALYRKPRTTRRYPEHRVYPYLLRGMDVCQPNQVWAMDITYSANPTRSGRWTSRIVRPFLGDILDDVVEARACLECIQTCSRRKRGGCLLSATR